MYPFLHIVVIFISGDVKDVTAGYIVPPTKYVIVKLIRIAKVVWLTETKPHEEGTQLIGYSAIYNGGCVFN